MRLLYFDSSRQLSSKNFDHKAIPPYAILSHTWGEAEFVFEDLVNGTGKGKAGYGKILFCGEQAAYDDLQYFWIDTCCIDKWNLRELSNAINSMFQWYKNAAKCYAFLSDVSTPIAADAELQQSTREASFRKSRWFTRGWTLQELLAPASIDFFSSEGQRLGDKDSLEQQIHEITRIPITALRGDPLEEFSVPERMAWMAARQTKHEEDMAYSLIGIFGVSMEFRYGEGKSRALERLQEEIEKANTTPFIVPLGQNTRFVGRESQLAKLRELLFVGASTTKVAITGPDGIGKTQLALELAYQTRRERKDCSVFWILASDKESLYQAYSHIVRRLLIPGWDDEKADARKLVQLHLSKESAGQWLLVFDNADEAGLDTAGSGIGVGLIEFLPSSEQGAIVFTTTNRTIAAKLAPENIVELPEVELDAARRMLDTYLFDAAKEQEKADLLLKELAYLPLAIVQAAAYVNVNNMALQGYLSLLAKTKEGLVEGQCRQSENVIAATWLLSFKQIRLQDALAADYLLFMACVDRNDVPLALLPAASSRGQEMNAVRTLDAYSLVTKRTAESALDVHRLVHVSTRNWLEKEGMLRQQTHVAITRLLEVFPDNNYGSRSKWRRLLPHAGFALSSGINRQEDDAKTELLRKCGAALYSDGRWKEAEDLFVQVIETKKRVLGEEHLDTLTSMANLASTYRNQGQWNEAEELEVQAMETFKRVLGEEHPDTLSSMANLASTFWNQGRWKEAKELFVHVMETRKRVLGEEHPNTLISVGNLALTYRNQGRWKEAEELFVQVMETISRVLGEEHPETLTSMANLASTYRDQGRWKEAEELEVQVMETRKRVLGKEHPDTLISMGNLASTFWNQGRWKEAEGLFVQALEMFKRVLGEEHPGTLTSMANLASTYRSQGRWKEAEGLEVQVLEMRKRVLGEEHPDTLTSMANLASTFWYQGRWQEAEELFVQVMEPLKRVLGEEHPDTLSSMANLASTYRSQGRWKKAEELFVQVMETSSRVLGKEHPSTLTSMGNLASTFWNQGRWKEAEELLVQVMEMRKRVLREEHPDTLASMANLASTYRSQGQWKEAEGLDVQVMETISRVLGEEHPDTLTSMGNLASTFWDQGRWKEGEGLFVQVMETRKRVLGDEHPSTLTSMAKLASTYWNQERWKEAEELEVQVMETRKRVLGEEHPSTLISMSNLASTYRSQGRWKEAEQLFVQVIEPLKRVLGEEHPDTLSSVANLASMYSNQGRWKEAEELQAKNL
ncbi:kinesin light chain 3 [Lentithecium fluviatile CBS 122367]|uniref:Kinesin light chain 3 n=1 Tax=Lentithecium fluviatile CBS 122367 TaxID=1168545 RepID=A0A6G1JFI6_9PLEO|nr:kinesin light chain 3 [Lentithecium fluviatile CBS 122367]